MSGTETAGRVLRLELTFDGSGFVGWQRQKAGRTVQAAVEDALARVTGLPHSVVGCGRTDAGVHARRYVASTRSASALPAPRLGRALDALLPSDVGLLRLAEAAPGFHALRDAEWKWYRYRLHLARTKRPLVDGRSWRRPSLPALKALSAAAAALEGRHDFASFGNAGSPRAGTVRTLHRVRWSRRGGRLLFDVVGDGFLYKMVRTLVGTQLAAACDPDPGATVAGILAARDRRRAGAAVPARGLMLMDVGYGGDAPPI